MTDDPSVNASISSLQIQESQPLSEKPLDEDAQSLQIAPKFSRPRQLGKYLRQKPSQVDPIKQKALLKESLCQIANGGDLSANSTLFGFLINTLGLTKKILSKEQGKSLSTQKKEWTEFSIQATTPYKSTAEPSTIENGFFKLVDHFPQAVAYYAASSEAYMNCIDTLLKNCNAKKSELNTHANLDTDLTLGLLNQLQNPGDAAKKEELLQLKNELISRLKIRSTAPDKPCDKLLKQASTSADLDSTRLIGQAWAYFKLSPTNRRLLDQLLLTNTCIARCDQLDISPAQALGKGMKLQDEMARTFSIWHFNQNISPRLTSELSALEHLALSLSYRICPNVVDDDVLKNIPPITLHLKQQFNPNLKTDETSSSTSDYLKSHLSPDGQTSRYGKPPQEYRITQFLRDNSGTEIMILESKDPQNSPLVIPIGTRFGNLFRDPSSLNLSSSGVNKDLSNNIADSTAQGKVQGEATLLKAQEMIESLGRPVIIAGHSLGGATAIALTEKLKPNCVQGVFTFGAPGIDNNQQEKIYKARSQAIVNYAIPAAILQKYFGIDPKEIPLKNLQEIKNLIADGKALRISSYLKENDFSGHTINDLDSFQRDCSLLNSLQTPSGEKIDQALTHFFGNNQSLLLDYIPFFHSTVIAKDIVGDLQPMSVYGVGQVDKKLTDTYGSLIMNLDSITRINGAQGDSRYLHNYFAYDSRPTQETSVEEINKLPYAKILEKKLVLNLWRLIDPLRKVLSSRVEEIDKNWVDFTAGLLSTKYGQTITTNGTAKIKLSD